jgi:four helix bundle protein
MRNFKKLMIWQLGMQLVDKVYDLVPSFPEEEKFGLRVQITKCAISIPSNIAEGSAKRSQKDYLRFVEISLASSFELETQTLVVQNRKWAPSDKVSELLSLVEREQKMITGFIDKL